MYETSAEDRCHNSKRTEQQYYCRQYLVGAPRLAYSSVDMIKYNFVS